MNQLFNRMIRAAKLDVNLYEEVEADKSATRQALVVVLIYSICAGIGSGLAMIWDESAGRFFLNLFVGLISALVFWLVWSFITYFIGTRLFKGPETQSNYGELLRTIGFAATPGIFLIFIFIPYIGGFIYFVVWVWMLIAMVHRFGGRHYLPSGRPYYRSIGAGHIWYFLGELALTLHLPY